MGRAVLPSLAANEYDKRDQVVAYFCRLYAVQRGIKIGSKTPECRTFLLTMMDTLEKIIDVKAEIVKRSFIVRLHRGLSNSKELCLAYTECRVVKKVKLQPQEQTKSQDQ